MSELVEGHILEAVGQEIRDLAIIGVMPPCHLSINS